MRKFQQDIPLSKFSHYKIGGIARFFFVAKTESDIAWAVRQAKRLKIKTFILAGGTNVLLPDDGFDGLVLHPDLKVIRIKKSTVFAGAGVSMDELVRRSADASLAGLEWAGGLPGTFGGAIRGNAGCFGGEIKDSIVWVKSFDTRKMIFKERSVRQCAFAYRDSIFKKRNGMEIVVGATLELHPGNKKEIRAAVREKIIYRATHHPIEYPNAGSMFKNVPVELFYDARAPKYQKAVATRTLVLRGSTFSIKTDPVPVISAAKLISESGLRGVSYGGAMISPKHPNFIVNVLNAGSDDVKNLIALAKAEVGKKFKVQLEEEVQMI